MRAVGESERLTPDLVLRAYCLGIFPMARFRDDPFVQWVAPERRGILPLDDVHVPRRLRRTVRSGRFQVRCNTAFADVIAACAELTDSRDETWINGEIERVYTQLNALGHAHSVEAWADGVLAGGLYGVHIGGAFFGESMFSRQRDASKVALVHLVARLRHGGFSLLDTQFVTEHLATFGAVEISAPDYLQRLDAALRQSARFYSELPPGAVDSAVAEVSMQSSSQMS